MKYKTSFTVIYSKKTGKILKEVWEPFQRLFWPLPWRRLSGKPEFSNYDELLNWFNESHPGKKIEYCYYGKSKCED